MKYYAGIDIGSSTTKAVILDETFKVAARCVRKSDAELCLSATRILAEAASIAGIRIGDIVSIVSTGYGRRSVAAARRSVTEIACHSRGCNFFYPRRITVIDIGGQDNKLIGVGENGNHYRFKMNRKCAAGTGAFIEEMALKLNIPLVEMNSLAHISAEETFLGNYCTVFSSTEVLTKIRAGSKVASIVKGVFRSIIKRIMEMDMLSGEIVMTGGVVEHNPVIAEMLEEESGCRILLPPFPQCIGAFGAALFARAE